jgi:hypothetical protein
MRAERRDVVSVERTRTELLAQLGRLKGKEDALRAQQSLIIYRLEQVVAEKERIKRRLAASPKETDREGT